jgi:signal transduction histidine kinase
MDRGADVATGRHSTASTIAHPAREAGRDDLAALVEAQARFISGARDHSVFAPLLERLQAATGSTHALVGAYDGQEEMPYILLPAGDAGLDTPTPAVAELVPLFTALRGSTGPLTMNDAGIGGRALSHPPLDHLLAVPLPGEDGLPGGLVILANRRGGYTRDEAAALPSFLVDAAGQLLAACRRRAAGALGEAEMTTALRRAERAERAKTAFLARISRELHAPLTAILGFADLIQQDAPESAATGQPNYRDFARDIRDAGSLMLRFVSDIAEVARIESGDVRLRPDWHDPLALARESVARMASAAADAGVMLALSSDPETLPRLWADGRLVRQAFLNLLSNAIRFTPTGGRVDMQLRQIEGPAGTADLEIEIADTGIGIARDRLDHLFEPFLRPSASASDGPGLGLALARSFIALNGGTLTVDSDPGAGTSVRILLPIVSVGSVPTSRE